MIDRILESPLTSYQPLKTNGRATPAHVPLSPSDLSHFIKPVEELITKYPAAALASAFVVGVVLACLIKRK